PVFTTELRVLDFAWRPDGEAIAFTALEPLSPVRAAARELGFQQTVLDEGFRRIGLWLWEHGRGQPRPRTTSGPVLAFVCAPPRSRLAAALAPRNLVDDSYMFTRLHRVDLEGDTTLLDDNPGKLGSFAWSPDGTQLAYIGAEDRRDP